MGRSVCSESLVNTNLRASFLTAWYSSSGLDSDTFSRLWMAVLTVSYLSRSVTTQVAPLFLSCWVISKCVKLGEMVVTTTPARGPPVKTNTNSGVLGSIRANTSPGSAPNFMREEAKFFDNLSHSLYE